MATNALLNPDNADVDEYVTLEDDEDDYDVEEQGDGSLIITMLGGERPKPHEEGGFYENLADGILPESVLGRIATDLLRKIEEDKKAREPRDKQYEEGLRRTGLGNDAPGGAEFEGASKVVHPMMTEAAVDCNAHIMKELWPINGPVRAKILGKVTKEKQERSERKVDYMNYQLSTLIEEARSTAETLFTQLPFGGSQFVKLWQDHRLKRPRMQFVAVDKIYLPSSAADYHSAQRRTFADIITEVEYQQRIDQGLYRDAKLSPPGVIPERSQTEKANAKIEGVDKDTGLNIDGEREVYEVMAYLEVTPEMADILEHEEEGQVCPYLMTIDVTSKKMLSFYRDWEEKDQRRVPIDNIFEFIFIPWRGALAIGLPQMIGGLSGAATGTLRALLDSALIANTQGGLFLKGSGAGGQTKRGQIGEFVEIEAGMEADDIRKKVMPFATKEPSAVLFQLLGFLVQAGKETIRTSMDEMPTDGSSPNTPVGTQLSLVEEGLRVFSAIHGRVHHAFDRMLAGLHRLNRLYLPDVIKVEVQGKEIFVMRKDFEGSPDIQPVSDPTIYSDQQRYAQMAAIEQSAVAFPGVYDMRAVQVRKLKLWKVPDPDELLLAAPKPTELNAVNENLAMALGRPVTVFPDQDHLAHLQVHLDFGGSPVFGQNPILVQKFLPAYVQHCAEHLCFQYVSMMEKLVSKASGVKATELMGKDERVKQAFDQLLALASQQVVPDAANKFAKAMPVLLQAFQTLQQIMPKPPMDPAAAAVQAAAAETQRKATADQATGALNAAKLQAAKQATDSKNQTQAQIAAQKDRTARDLADQKDQTTRDVAEYAADSRLDQTDQESQTALEIAGMRVREGQKPGFSTGRSLQS